MRKIGALIGIIMIGYLWSCAVKPKTLGAPEGVLSACPKSPNCICSQADSADNQHFMEAWKMDDFELDKTKVLKAIEDFGNAKVITNSDVYIYATFTTGWMKYIDDVEFYFDKSSNKIHFRSASRVGYSDMGVNRKRMIGLKKLFEGQVD